MANREQDYTPFEKVVLKVDAVLGAVENTVSSVCFAAMTLMVLFGIFSRYFISVPLTWIEETSRHLMVLGIYMGVSICTREKSHLALDMIPSMLPKVPSKILVFINQLIALVTLLFIAYLTIQYSAQAFKFNQLSPALRYPMGFMYAYIAFTFILSSLRHLMVMWNDYISKNKVLYIDSDSISAS